MWVTDGTRTRDPQDHNLMLYQLSYDHHAATGQSRPPNIDPGSVFVFGLGNVGGWEAALEHWVGWTMHCG